MNLENKKPDIKISVRQTFGIDTEMEVDSFSEKNPYVPEIDENYKFDRDTTLAILSGFAFNNAPLPTKRIADIVIMSNCTLKINFPKDQSVDEYVSDLQAQNKTNEIF